MKFQRPSLPIKVLIGALAVIVVLGIANSARAADPNWTGCYLGGNLGYLVQTSRAVDDQGPPQFTFDVSTATDGVTYGVGAGCDIRFGKSPLVVGVLGDIDWTNAGKAIQVGSLATGDTDISRSYALGGRAGFLVGSHVLLYGTGGYANVTMTTTLEDAKQSKANGYFIGGGVETMLDSGWSTKLEYRFTDLGNDTMKWAPAATAVADVDKNMHQIRLGISYKFEPAKEVSTAAASLDLPAAEPAKPAKTTTAPKGKRIAP